MSWEVVLYNKLSSTNDLARSLGLQGKNRVVVVADSQERGRGRKSRIWFSPPRKNLYFSILIRPRELPVEKSGVFTMAASLSISDLLGSVNVEHWIKWPNDIYVGHKKLCGILNEVFPKGNTVDFVVLGVGFNVNQSFSGTELEDTATSLYEVTGRSWDRMSLLLDLLDIVNRWLNVAERDIEFLRKSWIEKSRIIGKGLVVDGKKVKVIGVDENGLLVVKNQEGFVETLGAGDLYVPRG